MKGINHLKVFGVIVAVFIVLITIAYTMDYSRTSTLPERAVKDGMTLVQGGYVGIVGRARQLVLDSRNVFHTFEENRVLRQQMYNYHALEARTQQLEQENASLKALLDTGPSLLDFESLNATVIMREPHHWQDFIIVNRGQVHGVELDMYVMSKEGYLIGRVVDVFENSSRVQLVNRQNQLMKVPAVVSGTEAYGILHGFDSSLQELVMTVFERDIEISEGDTVITSGQGGVAPRGLLIGTVTRTETSADGLNQIVYMESGTNYNSLDFVVLVSRLASRPEVPAE